MIPAAPARATSSLERFAPWAAAALLALPVLIARYPPMTDLPLHEALVSILRHFSDGEMFPPGLYGRNLGQPNQLFHVTAWGLSYLFETDTACKIVVAAAVAAIPLSAARFADHIGASRLSALLVAPLALGWLFAWGLVANLVGLAIVVGLLPTLDRLARTPSVKNAAFAFGGAGLLYFGHYAMLSVYATAAVLFALPYPLMLRKTLLRLTPAASFVAFAGLQWMSTAHLRSPAIMRVKTHWVSIPQKLAQAAAMTFSSRDLVARWSFFGLCVIAIAALFWLRARERAADASTLGAPAAAGRLAKARAWIERYRFEAFSAFCFACYLAFPLTLIGATLVYQRFYAPAFAVLAVVATPRDLTVRRARVVRFLLPALTVGTMLLAWPSFADSDHTFRDLDQLLPHIAKGSAVAVLDLQGVPTRDFSLGASGGRILASRGGRLVYDFTDTTIAPIVVPPEHRWNETLLRIAESGWAMRPAYDLTRFRYVLVRSADPKLLMLTAVAVEPDGHAVASAGEYMLIASNLDVVPLTAPDAPLPTPHPATLRKRVKEVIARLTKDDASAAPAVPDSDSAEPPRPLPERN